MKALLKKIIYNKTVAKISIKLILRLHSFTYKLSGIYSSILNDGNHPKHKIINYFKWFSDNISEKDNVIDIGCNKGYMSYIISSKANYVYGIEILDKYIRYAKKAYVNENLKFFSEDATKFDYSKLPHSPSIIVLSNVLEHIDDRINFLFTIKKNLNKKVKFLIRVPMIDREWIVIYKKQLGLDYRLDKTHFIEYTFDNFKEELNKAGIDILNHEIKWGEIYAICE